MSLAQSSGLWTGCLLLNTVFVGFGRTLGNETAAATAATMAATQRRIVSTRDQIAVVFDRCGDRCGLQRCVCLERSSVALQCAPLHSAPALLQAGRVALKALQYLLMFPEASFNAETAHAAFGC